MGGLNYIMTEYKRLTNKDWKENYDIFEDVCCDTCAEDCGECERNFNALVRLAELEDKIESGKLADVADSKTYQTITDLLIEFDEMGFIPTTVCPDSEQYAIDWRERVRKEFARLTSENERLRAENAKIDEYRCVITDISEQCEQLKSENTQLNAILSKMEIIEKELRESLERTIELKAKKGDTLYMPWEHNGTYGIATLEIMQIRLRDKVQYFTILESDDELYLYKYNYGIFYNKDFDNMVFTDRSKAEAHLAKLKRSMRNETN